MRTDPQTERQHLHFLGSFRSQKRPSLTCDRIHVLVRPHGIWRRDEPQGLEVLVLHCLLVLQVDLPAHEVDEDLQVVS